MAQDRLQFHQCLSERGSQGKGGRLGGKGGCKEGRGGKLKKGMNRAGCGVCAATCKAHLPRTWMRSPKEQMVNLMLPAATSEGGTNTPFQFREETKGCQSHFFWEVVNANILQRGSQAAVSFCRRLGSSSR